MTQELYAYSHSCRAGSVRAAIAVEMDGSILRLRASPWASLIRSIPPGTKCQWLRSCLCPCGRGLGDAFECQTSPGCTHRRRRFVVGCPWRVCSSRIKLTSCTRGHALGLFVPLLIFETCKHYDCSSFWGTWHHYICLLYTSPSPRD